MEMAIEIIIALVLSGYLVWKVKSKKKSSPSIDEETNDVSEQKESQEVAPITQEKEDIKQQTDTEPQDEIFPTKFKHFNPNSPRKPQVIPEHSQTVKEDFKKFAGMKILVAEDNLINQKVIAGLLNESGIELVFAGDGMEALSILNNQHDFDLVLMDAHMPNMDGFEATQKIRQQAQFQQLPVVALSGDIASDDIKKMYNAGMDAHLEKPLKMDALYEVLEAFNSKKSTQTTTTQQTNSVLDTQEGIKISGGDEEFYKEILKEFLQQYANAHEEVRRLLEEEKREKADALLLDIGGITANIGAKESYELAMQLKERLLQNASKEEILKRAKEFTKAYEKLLEAIRSYLD